MTIRLLTHPRPLASMCAGPLASYIDAYTSLLHQQGYSHKVARTQLLLVADLSKWLQRRRLTAADLDGPLLDRYLRDRKSRQHAARGNRSALQKLMALLREHGIDAKQAPSGAPSMHQRIEEEYRRYLVQERGLSAASVHNYLPVVQKLLSERFSAGRIQLDRLCAVDIIGFVQRHAHELSPGRAKLMTTALRSFLRHLQHQGKIDTDLAASVPCVPRWSLTSVPKFLAPGQVHQVLEHCDRRTASGIRDYAILLLLARLGLRACEVVSLTLEDIDWHAGKLRLCGKGKRWAELPLSQEVGHALARYLRRGRPRCGSRRVFIRAHAPRSGFADSSAICCVVDRALARAGIDCVRRGAHLFRHTLATDMLRQGASLTEIGQLLRHRHPSTTLIYAKVDLSALKALALPWPGGGR